ncbi:MAG TPA: amidohydrolase family protein [Luteitalea sp.]|nr:amidohydrolase family protein [Luteitalea sp.]
MSDSPHDRQCLPGRRHLLLGLIGAAAGPSMAALAAQSAAGATSAIEGARWWTGQAFEPRRMFVVQRRFSRTAPARIDRHIDLAGAYVVPPYADAHNHGIGTGDTARDAEMVARYRRDGVLYMQSLGNLPLARDERERLGLGATAGVDARLAQGSITGPGGHPMGIIRDRLLPAGCFPGQTLDTLRGRRFHEIATAEQLREQWPVIRRADGDLVKCFLFNSGSYTQRRDDPAYFGRRGLDPGLVPLVVSLAHADGLPVAAHVVDMDDYRAALDGGVDVIGHIPTDGTISEAEAKRTAERRVTVLTTCAFLARLAGPSRAAVIDRQRTSLTRLRDAKAHLAIGTDDPTDTGLGEIRHLATLGVFSAAELLDMWTGASARAIFPRRQVGSLADGAEASFLALDADPLADWANALRIRARYRQGELLPA